MTGDPTASPDADGWLAAVLDAERHGELLTANDVAERGLEAFPEDRRLQYRAVLALARAGSTDEAARRYERYRLDQVDDEDSQALRARIAKDTALAAGGVERARAAQLAADRYAAVYDRTGGYFSAVNAATMTLVAGQRERACELATEVLTALDRVAEPSYYTAATAAEARLLLGDVAAAQADLVRAAELAGGDFGAMSTTRRQLRLICSIADLDPAVLEPLAAPGVVHFCGHLIAAPGVPGRFTADAEPAARTAIDAVVASSGAGYAYGALACGGDILWAEALLRFGADLHVTLPFAIEDFRRHCVAPGGADWVPRFERCLHAAKSVDYATDGAYLNDDVLYRYGTELSMGSAILRARHLDTSVEQLALWDGGPAAGEAGTGIDVATWNRRGLHTTVVTPSQSGPFARGTGAPSPGRRTPARVVRALLFADVKGFSALADEQLPPFATHVLGRLADALQRHRDAVLHQNTWGDAVYVVLDDVVAAAECANDLQLAMRDIDLAAVGLPPHLALRLSGHVGPVFPIHDPVIDRAAFMGAHVSRTARIEPVTPPGIIYVTEQFAAALALRGDHDYRGDYVGHMPTAKDYGRLRMYRLRRIGN